MSIFDVFRGFLNDSQPSALPQSLCAILAWFWGECMFITLEGGEGAGKTTLAQQLKILAEAAGYEVCLTRQPGGTGLGQAIRRLLLDGAEMAPTTELLLYAADRAEHVAQVIRPALAAGQIVLCDRYTDSTVAYQGYGRGLDLVLIQHLNHVATGGLLPDCTLWLDVPVAVGLGRLDRSRDRLERSDVSFHERLYAGFLTLAQQEPSRIRRLDATQAPDTVAGQAWGLIQARLNSSPASAELA